MFDTFATTLIPLYSILIYRKVLRIPQQAVIKYRMSKLRAINKTNVRNVVRIMPNYFCQVANIEPSLGTKDNLMRLHFGVWRI